MNTLKSFKSLFSAAVLGMGAVLALGASADAQVTYECPASAQIGMTNIPADWAGPDQTVPMTRVSQSTDGQGRRILNCHYGEYRISRMVEANRSCTRTATGFTCRSNVAENGGRARSWTTYTNGEFRWQTNQNIDLDKGHAGVNAAAADLVITDQELISRGGARFSGPVERGTPSSCDAASKTLTHLRRSRLPAGSRFCLETNDGRLSSVLVRGNGEGGMTVIYRTWDAD